MLQNISWTDYIMAVAVALVVYYLVIGVRYFSSDIKELLSGKRRLKFRMSPAAVSDGNNVPKEEQQERDGEGFENTSDNEFTEVEHLIERLKSVIADASRRKLIPDEFKQYIAMVFKEYPSVRYSPLRSSVNELIVSECQKYGAVTLKDDEVDLLWKEAV